MWGLNNDDAGMPSGWRNDLLDFKKYGGPGTSYSGGRLPPRIEDLIVHYFYLLGINYKKLDVHLIFESTLDGGLI